MICRGKHRICELSTVLMQTVFIIHNIWSWIITYVTSCAHIGLDHIHSRTFFYYHVRSNDQIPYYHVRCWLSSTQWWQTHHIIMFVIDYHVRTNQITYIVMHAVDYYVRRNTASNVYVSTKSIYYWLLWSYPKNTHIKIIDQNYRIVN